MRETDTGERLTERGRSEGIGMEVGEGDGERDEERRVGEERSRRREERE